MGHSLGAMENFPCYTLTIMPFSQVSGAFKLHAKLKTFYSWDRNSALIFVAR